MLYLVGKGTIEECRAMAEKAIADGSAFETFCTMVREQGGDDSVLRDYEKFAQAPYKQEILAERDGFITKMNAEEIGEIFFGNLNGSLFPLDNLAGSLAAYLSNDALQLPDTSFLGIILNDFCQYTSTEMNILRLEPILFTLTRYQIALGDFKFFDLRVAGKLNDFHSITKWTWNIA